MSRTQKQTPLLFSPSYKSMGIFSFAAPTLQIVQVQPTNIEAGPLSISCPGKAEQENDKHREHTILYKICKPAVREDARQPPKTRCKAVAMTETKEKVYMRSNKHNPFPTLITKLFERPLYPILCSRHGNPNEIKSPRRTGSNTG